VSDPGWGPPGQSPSGPWPEPGQPAPSAPQPAGTPPSPQPQPVGTPPSPQPQAAPQAGGWQTPVAGGLHLRTRFFPLAFLLYLFPPRCSIDGSYEIPIRWGDNPLPVPPGRHHVRVWFPYLFYGQCGVAEAVVDVPTGGLFLEYKAPTWWVFSRGSFPGLAQAGAAGAAGSGAGWHPDPTGRAEQRYWDGQAWTGHVVRGGATGWDPV
jgi:Protein of unknown function (DUF2510)